MTALKSIVAANRAGQACAIPSVCTAQPDAILAALLLAQSRKRPVLIEATSNQVNQYGGYTGMQPRDYIGFVRDLAARHGVDHGLIHFGGDHLGPQAWRDLPADQAMNRARQMMRDYVRAGFTKIHLDCSEGCAGEAAQVDETTSAGRAAELAAVCEVHAPDPENLVYVIGTEVPPPGGARADEPEAALTPTPPARARHTLACHKRAFAAAGIASAWPRVIGLVVQPGLEFSSTHIDRFEVSAPNRLSDALGAEPGIGFEAHSTDFQHDDVFPELARRNFAILKVGPALTFAYRQALYALDHLRGRLIAGRSGTGLSEMMEQLMLAEPTHWHKHLTGDEAAQRVQRHFGYADRIRYYWPRPEALAAVNTLLAELETLAVPPPLAQQYFAPDVAAAAERLDHPSRTWPKALILAQIQKALAPYFFDAD